MKIVLRYSLLALGLALSASTAAYADPSWWHHEPPPPPPPRQHDYLAPEVDPGLAISGFALLGGTLTVLRARRRK